MITSRFLCDMPCIDEVCLTCNSQHEEMKMSSGEVRKVSRQDIQLVQNLIERCHQLYMNQKEVVDTLLKQAKIEPGFTELVWQKLEEENREFFKAYQVRLMLKNQIVVFNRLLEKQVELMRKVGPSGIVSGPFSNGSNTSTWVGGKFMVDPPFALGGGRRDGLRREPVTGFPYISTSQYHQRVQVRALHASRVVSESEKVRAVVANRPLSPHLALKKPQLSATYSISHRIFGAAVASLILATPVLVKFSVMFDV